MNDRWVSDYYQSYYPMWSANYNWDENVNRVILNNSDESAYYIAYGAISTYNLILENIDEMTDCTQQQCDELAAQAHMMRAMTLFNVVNYYSDIYTESTASQKGGVPIITSANIGAAYTQPSVKEVYDFILADMEAAYTHLPSNAATILHPDKAAADAFYARLYLQMGNYTEALQHAEKALAVRHELYDWREFYANYQSIITDPSNRTRMADPADWNYCENYIFLHGGNSNYSSAEQSIPLWRGGDRFEQGDARAAARWKYYDAGNDIYYYATLNGYHNYGGITVTEVYLILAECLARNGQIAAAMDALNTVRQSRILADVYAPLSASTEAEAMQYIIRTKQNELLLTTWNFNDARRLNAEGKYPVLPIRTVNGITSTLSASSHLWTFPFPQGAVENSGNGTITQNVEK